MKIHLRHPVVQNALALYSVQFAEYVLPMLTMPYLARVLHPAGWGMVVYAQNFAAWLILILEYGFGFSATRDIARYRDRPDRHPEIVGGVTGASLLLLVPALLVTIVSSFTVPAFRDHQGYLLLAVALALTQGLRPFWYFQGIESMRYPAVINIVGRVIFTIGVFAFVRTQSGGWIVLAVQAVAGSVVTVTLAVRMYNAVGFYWPTLQRAIGAIRNGWSIFLSRSAVSLYTTANTFILGLFVSSTGVAYYGAAERVVLIIIGLMAPFTQALYPRMSHLAANDRERAARTVRMGLLFFGVSGLAAGGALILAAPLVVHIFGAADYRPVIAIMRVASISIPLVAVSNILGLQWMLPSGMDKAFNRISLGAGILNVGLALFLAPRFGPIGTAWSVVAAQGFVTTSQCLVFVSSKGRFPPTPVTETAVAE